MCHFLKLFYHITSSFIEKKLTSPQKGILDLVRGIWFAISEILAHEKEY
jgi:hypothetical protein